MGNHNVGRAISSAAKGFWAMRPDSLPTKEEALAYLDAVSEEWRGADAEFDDELYPDTPLGRLVAIAFDATPEEIADEEDEEEMISPWFDGPYMRFSRRYDFR